MCHPFLGQEALQIVRKVGGIRYIVGTLDDMAEMCDAEE